MLVVVSIHVAAESNAGITHLSTRVISDKGDLARNIDLRFRLSNFLLLLCLGNRAISTAVVDNVINSTEEGRVAMKIDFPVIGLIPLGIEH